MRLRNKKTGEIVGLSIYGIEVHIRKEEQPFYHSLAELNEEWEDYKEPLIKDEKVRKAVRAWAEANNVVEVNYYESSHYFYLRAFDDYERGIDFWLWHKDGKEQKLIENKTYTITELCGEEE